MNINDTCNYVCAALPSYTQHSAGTLKENPDYINEKNLYDFTQANVNKFLSSYGIALIRGRKIDAKLNKRYQKTFDFFYNKSYMKDCEFIIDSGGFQVQMEYLQTKEDTNIMIKMYHEFLLENWEKFKYAFVLDLAPGPTSCIYDSFAEMENYNHISYEASANLPEKTRDKMMWIHHFRTTSLNNLWSKMLFEENLADKFKNFATGGLVSSSGGKRPPIVLYTIPLISILTHAKSRNLKKFRFHILGGSEWKDLIFHKLAEIHIKKCHDIDVTITYDSSTIFKLLAMSRCTFLQSEIGKLWKISVKSSHLDKVHPELGNHKEAFFKHLNDAVTPYGMKPLDVNTYSMYDGESGQHTFNTNNTGKMTRLVYQYGILHLLKLYADMDAFSSRMAKEIYPLYESGNVIEFDMRVTGIMKNLNNGKISKRLRSKSNTIYNSLKELEQMDLTKMSYIIDQTMTDDEVFGTHKQPTKF